MSVLQFLVNFFCPVLNSISSSFQQVAEGRQAARGTLGLDFVATERSDKHEEVIDEPQRTGPWDKTLFKGSFILCMKKRVVWYAITLNLVGIVWINLVATAGTASAGAVEVLPHVSEQKSAAQ